MKTIGYALYIIACFVFTISVLFHVSMILIPVIVTRNIDWQICLFLFLSILFISSFVCLFFVNLKLHWKCIIFISLCLFGVNYIPLTILIPSVSKIIEMNLCVDRGYLWNDEKKYCDVNWGKVCYNSSDRDKAWGNSKIWAKSLLIFSIGAYL